MSTLASWLSAAASSALSYFRRNRRRLVYISIAGAAAAATAAYVSRQYRGAREGLREEREAGVRWLRRQFGVNEGTVERMLEGMIGMVRDVVWGGTEAELLVARLRERGKQGVEGEEKREVWERLKIVAFTRLVAAIYGMALVDVLLVARIHLLGRYAAESLDAPIERLPAGDLVLRTQQKFLGLVKKRCFEDKLMEEVIDGIGKTVERVVREIHLKEKFDAVRLKELIKKIALQFRRTEGKSLLSIANVLSNVQENEAVDSDENEERTGEEVDPNFNFLEDEMFDLCELLDFETVLMSNVAQLLHVLDTHIEKLLPAESYGPLAKLIPQLVKLSGQVLETTDCAGNSSARKTDNSSSDKTNSFVDVLSKNPQIKQFAAAIFLSGEKDGTGTRRTPRSGIRDRERSGAADESSGDESPVMVAPGLHSMVERNERDQSPCTPRNTFPLPGLRGREVVSEPAQRNSHSLTLTDGSSQSARDTSRPQSERPADLGLMFELQNS